MEESTNYRYVSGWLLPAGINVEPQPVLVPNDDIDGIVNMIGGNCRLFDCVSHDVADEDGNRTTIVGFVDDEGLYDPAADVNYLASAAFGRMEPLVGNVVVVGAINPMTGVNDGHSHDLPEWVTDRSTDLVLMCADAYNKAAITSVSILAAIEDGVLDLDEVERIMNAPTDESNLRDVAKAASIALRYAEMQMESDDEETIGQAVERLTSFGWEEGNN